MIRSLKHACDSIQVLDGNKLYSLLAKARPTQPVKIDLNKKSLPKQKTIQNFTLDAQGLRKTKNENPPTWEMGVTS